MKRFFILTFLSCFFLVSFSAKNVSKEKKVKNPVIESVSKLYNTVKTYKSEIHAVLQFKQGTKTRKVEENFVLYLEMPNKIKMISKSDTGIDFISDGKVIYIISKKDKAYIKRKISDDFLDLENFVLPILSEMGGLGSMIFGLFEQNGLSNIVLNAESVNVEKENNKNVIVMKKKDATVKLYLDDKNYIKEIKLKIDDKVRGTYTYVEEHKNIEMNKPISKSIFSCKIPKGYKELNPEVSLEGEKSKDFTLKSLSGKEITLSKLKGKIVILDFFATWCGPCREELPIISEVCQKYKDNKNVLFFAINNEDEKKVKKFLEKHNIVLDAVLHDDESKVSKLYNIRAIPTLIIIDKKGTIVKIFKGLEPKLKTNLTRTIEKLLKEK